MSKHTQYSFSHWQRPIKGLLPTKIAPWLTDEGSLTRLVTAVCEEEFSVQLLDLRWQKLWVDEAVLLAQALHQQAYQRQVLLLDGLSPKVYARTVIPLASYQALANRIEGLGSRPLGELLFTDRRFRRGPIKVAKLAVGDKLYNSVNRYTKVTAKHLWARRSCFYFKQLPILVNEVFLPSECWSQS